MKMSAVNCFVFALLYIVVAVSGQSANCDNVQSMSNLEPSRLSGDWMAVEHANDEGEYTCLRERCQVSADGRSVSEATLVANGVKLNYTAFGSAVDGNPAKVSFVLSYDPENPTIAKLLDTDYDNYVIWSWCKSADSREISILVMARQGSPFTEQTRETVKQVLRAKNVDDQLVAISQENC